MNATSQDYKTQKQLNIHKICVHPSNHSSSDNDGDNSDEDKNLSPVPNNTSSSGCTFNIPYSVKGSQEL